MGHITWCMDKMSGQNPGRQNANQNCKGGQMLAILWDREGKMPVLSKHFIYDTDGQVSLLKKPL